MTNAMRKRLKDHREVCHYWANKVQSQGACGNIFFEGPTIYSYGHHFPMARFTGEHVSDGREIVLMTTDTYSSTTSGHMSMLRQAVNRTTSFVLDVPDVAPPVNHGKNLASFQERIDRIVDELRRCRQGVSYRLNRIDHLSSDAVVYQCAFMGRTEWFGPSPCTLPSDFQSIVNKAREREQRKNELDEKKSAAMRAAREERELLELLGIGEKIEAWRAGKSVSLPWQLPVMLRLNGDTVETSKGARVPLRDAEKLYRFAQQYAGTSYQSSEPFKIGVYTLDRLDADGTIHAGCHTIGPEEINRFAKERGWSE
jgi:hypothetical protein